MRLALTTTSNFITHFGWLGTNIAIKHQFNGGFYSSANKGGVSQRGSDDWILTGQYMEVPRLNRELCLSLCIFRY